MAAGVGRRYRGLKQLEPVGPGGETLIEYSVFDAARTGFERTVLVIRRETERQFRERLDDRLRGVTCEELGYSGGELDCHANCSFDVSGCTL